MGGGDKFLLGVAKSVVMSGLENDTDTILYRQEVLKDCLKNPSVIRVTTQLGTGNKGSDYLLNKPVIRKLGWLRKFISIRFRQTHVIHFLLISKERRICQ